MNAVSSVAFYFFSNQISNGVEVFKAKSKSDIPYNSFSETGAVVKINVRFFIAVSLAYSAFEIWPSNLENWGLGVIALCCSAAALAQMVRALRDTFAVLKRERVIGKQVEDAMTAKHARDITADVLRDAGMK